MVEQNSQAKNGELPKAEYSDYEVGGLLGEGAYGRVSLAIEKKTQRQVAIKEINKQKISEVGLIHHIFREKTILMTLREHPNIIELITTCQDTENLYFVFEVSTQGTLNELCMERGKLSLDVCRGYAAQIASLLHFLQIKDIVHRDMKPHNLMLDDDLNIKLIDFGDAKDLNEKEEEVEEVDEMNIDNTADQQMKAMQEDFSKQGGGRRGTLVGTINYLSPEMIKEQRACLSTDLWAFGVILYKMATGRVPFPGTQQATVYELILSKKIDWPVDLDEQCRDLIEKVLQAAPEERLGAPNTNHDMTKLLQHPFFQGKKLVGTNVCAQYNMKQLLLDSEPPQVKAKRLQEEANLKHKMLRVEKGEPVLKGRLLKQNKFWMKQERDFILYLNGEIKYFKGKDHKGTMQLVKGHRCIKDGKLKATIDSKAKPFFLLQMPDISKCEHSDRYSCKIDDWVEAVNLVIEEL